MPAVYGVGEDIVTAFTDQGIENLKARPATGAAKRPMKPAKVDHNGA